jgi:hypothetical protein
MLTLVVLALTALVVGCSEESGNSSAGSPATAERKLVPTFEIHVVEAYPYPKDEKQMSLFGKIEKGRVRVGDKGIVRCKDGDRTVTVKLIVIATEEDGNPDANGDHERKVQEASEGVSGLIRVEGISQECEWLDQKVTGVVDT